MAPLLLLLRRRWSVRVPLWRLTSWTRPRWWVSRDGGQVEIWVWGGVGGKGIKNGILGCGRVQGRNASRISWVSGVSGRWAAQRLLEWRSGAFLRPAGGCMDPMVVLLGQTAQQDGASVRCCDYRLHFLCVWCPCHQQPPNINTTGGGPG
jgi:hypothetical protein